MDLENWREGINICITNVEQLYEDGILLLENGSYGHACFSFITALEEMAVAFFIIGNFDEPKPKKLKNFLKHSKKLMVSNLLRYVYDFPDDIDSSNFFRTLFNEAKKSTKGEKNKKAIEKLVKDVQEQENIWYLRNRGIYVDLNTSKTRFIHPQQINRGFALALKKKLRLIRLNLKIQRDLHFKFEKELLDKQDGSQILKALAQIEGYDDLFNRVSIEKVEKSGKISPEFKDFLISIFMGNEPEEYKPLNIDFSEYPKEERFEKVISIMLFEFVKIFAENLNSLIFNEEAENIKNFAVERLRHYEPEFGEFLVVVLDMMKKIAEDRFTFDDYIEFMKSVDIDRLDKILSG